MSEPIKGYRSLNADEIALINRCKKLAEQTGELIAELKSHRNPAYELDHRWISIGATDLQKGWMSVIRGIAKPTTF